MPAPFDFAPREYPTGPGVYLMKDAQGRILYAGKATSLRKRLASYFRAAARLSAKTLALLARVRRIDVLLASSEKEALLLEASLIKKHRPRYNVVLRDDKQYALFRLDKRSPFPRLSVVRRVVRDGSAYFGPFPSASAARETLKLLGKAFPLRKCSEAAFKNRVRPCLYHDLGLCLAPCVLPVPAEQYRELVRGVERVLSGRKSELAAELEREMEEASKRLEFERAAGLRDRLRALRQTLERQAAVLAEERDLDVAALAGLPRGLGLGLAVVRRGRLLDEQAFFFAGLSLDDGPEALASFLIQYYGPERLIPPRIVTAFALEDEALAEVLAERRGGPLRIGPPAGSAEKRLLALAREVAARGAEKPEAPDIEDLLRERLHLPCRPGRIECVDVSHLGGEGLRAGLVVFEDGRRNPEASRLYAFPELEGASDDYAALAAFARRRIASGPPWPGLLLVDGGKGQLAAVARAWAEAGGPAGVELAAIAKGPTRRAGELHDRVFRPGRRNPLALRPGGPELLFLQAVRDAAHRFVLGGQRKARKRKMLESEVLGLPGVGPKTARLLWERFGSVEAMARATLEELRAIPGLGAKKATAVFEALRALRRG